MSSLTLNRCDISEVSTAQSPVVYPLDKQQQPAIKIISKEVTQLCLAKPSSNYTPQQLNDFPASSQRSLAPETMALINDYSALNQSDCYALNMLKIFASIATTMQSNTKWQEQMVDVMDKLNTCLLGLSKNLQEILSEVQAQHKRELLDAVRHGGVIGLLLNIATIVVGVLCCLSPATTVMGVAMILNSSVQMAGNIGKIADPEAALKENSWENSLCQNGMFAIFDLTGKDGGQKAQVIGTIAMLLLTEGASAASTIANRAALTALQLLLRGFTMFDSILKVVGMVGNSLQDSSASANSDTNTDHIWAALSMGSFATAIHEIIHQTGLDEGTAGKIIDNILGAVVGIAIQTTVQYGSFSKMEDLQLAKITKLIRQFSQTYDAMNQTKSLNLAEVRCESAIKNYDTQLFTANNSVISKQYDAQQTSIDALQQIYGKQNDGLMKNQQELMDIVKQLEQTFQQIFKSNAKGAH